MKNTIGTSVRLTLAGESHGEMIVAVLDGMAPGIPVDESFIAAQLSRRRPRGPADTARREPDEYRIVSGCFEGCTTGAPLTILI
ncbi:MAG: chorismate synthase, partial [Bacteroidales bacterium]|nr:chorismate synthase [Bacteroidales bacterium]